MRTPLLGVNVDHIATIRQARNTSYPQPVNAALEAEKGGADGITVHLREDFRHIQREDVRLIKKSIRTRLNLEIALNPAMLDFACEVKPAFVCLVPEKRRELTTEGGLDVLAKQKEIAAAHKTLAAEGVQLSLFIDANERQLSAARETGVPFVELHTGKYADAQGVAKRKEELDLIIQAARYAAEFGMSVNAGHGLNYENVAAVAAIPQLYELNIGHSIVARALFIGIRTATEKMKTLVENACR